MKKELRIFINPNSGIPVYIQISESIKSALIRGLIKEGDRLPGVRDLAVQIPANPNTVAKAYQRLISEGILEYKRGIGTFVRKFNIEKCKIKNDLKYIVAKAKEKGITEKLFIDWVKEEYEK